MSMRTEVDYGYGIDVSKLQADFIKMNPDFETAYDKLMMILDDAPMFRDDCYMPWIDDNMMELNESGIEFCFEWEGFGQGLGEILRSVIAEKYKLEFVSSTDENSGEQYLMYCPSFPWQMSPDEKKFNKADIDSIFNKYSLILCNVRADIDDVRAEYCC